MASWEQAERIGGAGFLGVPAFEGFVWILDNIARVELLVRLHDYLPAFLVNPAVAFICMCIGLVFLYLAHKKQLRRMRKARLLDSSGTEYQNTENPKWPVPVLIVFLIALIATPLLAVGYSLAYKGEAPKSSVPPSPPYFAYSKTPTPETTMNTPAQQQSGSKNIQTGAITQGPCSNLQMGGGNQSTINCAPPQLTMTDDQMNEVADYLSGKLTSARVHIFVDHPTEPLQTFSKKLQKALGPSGADVDEQEGMYLGPQGETEYPGISFSGINEDNVSQANEIGVALNKAGVIKGAIKAHGGKFEDGRIQIIIRSP